MNPIALDPPIIEEADEGWLIPAHPRPLDTPPGALRLALLARRSLIARWTAVSYAAQDYDFRLLRRQICVYNVPASIRAVFVTAAELFERKGAMMRRALAPLLGDGLFISDGETWCRRRPLLADIAHKTQVAVYAPMVTGAAAEMLQPCHRGQACPPHRLQHHALACHAAAGRAVPGEFQRCDRPAREPVRGARRCRLSERTHRAYRARPSRPMVLA
ncbi:MAG: hypothetical protein ING16_08920 [Roseomonas sp.]|nr:hypothetical protein [Roseomonas sp.]MCA3282978.1 hypothetical protein [Roseomonas sp.]MCA3297789.1 hypothetical protein [Roseomonas sp.]